MFKPLHLIAQAPTLETPQSTNLLKPAEVQRRLSISRVTLWRLVRDQALPRPYRVSPGRIAWAEREVEEYISSCRAPVGPANDPKALH